MIQEVIGYLFPGFLNPYAYFYVNQETPGVHSVHYIGQIDPPFRYMLGEK